MRERERGKAGSGRRWAVRESGGGQGYEGRERERGRECREKLREYRLW